MLTGKQTHGRCFVCGPAGRHLQPCPPEYPPEWNEIVSSKHAGTHSCTMNNIFSLTALGVYDGDFMHWDNGVSAVTLKGGRMYHWLIPAEQGEHVIQWFLYDPMAIHSARAEHDLPCGWLSSIPVGLESVNPFVNQLENLAVAAAVSDDMELSLQLDQPEHVTSNEIAAIISLAPTSKPSHQKIVIRWTGQMEHMFLDLLSPYVKPLHYLLLLPYSTSGWSPDQRTHNDSKFSQMCWYRMHFFMNAEQMYVFLA